MVFPDGNRKIEIEDSIIKRASQYRQISLLSYEAGGALIGREIISTNNLIVDQMTEPLPKDKRCRYRFYRRDPRHKSFFNQLFSQSGGKYKYVGEWHTHPERVPKYSSLDKNEWIKIIKDQPDIAPIYCVIFGVEKWRVWKVETENNNPILIYEGQVLL